MAGLVIVTVNENILNKVITALALPEITALDLGDDPLARAVQ